MGYESDSTFCSCNLRIQNSLFESMVFEGECTRHLGRSSAHQQLIEHARFSFPEPEFTEPPQLVDQEWSILKLESDDGSKDISQQFEPTPGHQTLQHLNFDSPPASDEPRDNSRDKSPVERVYQDLSANEQWNSETTLLISREGTRKNRRNFECTFLNRVRKSDEQTRYLIGLFDQTNGRVPKEVRRRAEEQTGLTWIQIYKWIFDRKTRKKEFTVNRLLEYPVPIFRVTRNGKDITGKRPIFKLERAARATMRLSGKPGNQ